MSFGNMPPNYPPQQQPPPGYWQAADGNWYPPQGTRQGKAPMTQGQKTWLGVGGGCGGLIVLLIIIGALSGSPGSNTPTSTTPATPAPTYANYTFVPTPIPTAIPTATPTPTPQVSVTMKSFTAIQNGMTLQQVQALLGHGTLTSESSIEGITDTVYLWYAPGDLGDVTVAFENNSVISKAQFGLS